MARESWVIITDELRVGGMQAAAAAVSDSVTAAVVGTADLAASVAGAGFAKVLLFECAEGVPAEALAADVAKCAAAAQPGLVVCGETATARVVAGAVAGAIGAATVASVIGIRDEGGALVLSTEVANRKAVEDVKVAGSALAVFIGADVDMAQGAAAPVEAQAVSAVADAVVGAAEPQGAGLASAQRVVSAGMGLGSRDNLALTEGLAEVIGAYCACTLPASEDMHWYEADHVVGSSHNSTAPELYIAVGISGSPNHTSGHRDAKVVAAINNDPNAEIFNVAKYGVVGDLNKVVPAMIDILKG